MIAPTVLITSTGNIPRTLVACLASVFDTTVGFAVVSMATQPLLFCPLVGKRHAVGMGPIWLMGICAHFPQVNPKRAVVTPANSLLLRSITTVSACSDA